MMAQFSAWWSWLRAGATDAVTVWWLWLAGAVGVAVLYGAWWLWWRLPKRQMRSITAADPKARADIEDNFRKTIGQLLGGAAVLIGAALAYLQFTQQQRSAQEQFSKQQQTSHEQLLQQEQASRDLLISNQVSKGFEQLGSDKLVVRLGGIYALEGVMSTSKEYHQPLVEALSAFVRDGTRTDKSNGPPKTDIQAVLTVLGRRKDILKESPYLPHVPYYFAHDLRLTASHIPKADLRAADLEGAILNETDLSGASLRGAHLSGAYLNDANLTGADLQDAALVFTDLTGANLTGADLTDAKLTGAGLRNADLRLANLTGAKLTGAGLIGTRLSPADLSGANLKGAKTTQAQLDQACGTNAKLDPGLTLKPCS
jgi:hypothetical protein